MVVLPHELSHRRNSASLSDDLVSIKVGRSRGEGESEREEVKRREGKSVACSELIFSSSFVTVSYYLARNIHTS